MFEKGGISEEYVALLHEVRDLRGIRWVDSQRFFWEGVIISCGDGLLMIVTPLVMAVVGVEYLSPGMLCNPLAKLLHN
ncbi:hypothetical protein E2C01_037560 [Portunus trituberculatus]|uniref:Uncharacterized protein n=1 Tax=Portunus trituberculatus TaxID=210409 RepID=A0A5B7FEE4_PORTR|nr:hypothetical protein [Portunus trituberculatus]